uniref:Uncharacterized protein n=1 Tax=Siphoviridae sp. ctqSm5 TaxID=2827949 RepID=A0A8S5SQ86_9CAUD|nr:MAG TPA: hypothetical protein [Siphoviridae sp. ctqSm5]
MVHKYLHNIQIQFLQFGLNQLAQVFCFSYHLSYLTLKVL